MTVVRLTKNVNGKVKYVSKHVDPPKTKNGKHRLTLTNNRANAYLFETMEAVFQFWHFASEACVGINVRDLKLEREEIDQTFEERFGEDPLRDVRLELMNKLAKEDALQSNLAKVIGDLNAIAKINPEELSEENKLELLNIRANLEYERDIYITQLNELAEEGEELNEHTDN